MNEGIFPGFSAGRPVELYLPEIIHEETLQANGAFDIRDIPCIYDRFEIECRLRSSVSATIDVAFIFFNGDITVANYAHERFGATDSGISGARADTPQFAEATGSTSPADSFQSGVIHISGPKDNKNKTALTYGGNRRTSTSGRIDGSLVEWENTAPITRIQIRTDNHPTDLFVKGSMVRLIGWRRFRLQP